MEKVEKRKVERKYVHFVHFKPLEDNPFGYHSITVCSLYSGGPGEKWG